MPGLFDDVLHKPEPTAAPAPAAHGGGLFDDVLTAAPPDTRTQVGALDSYTRQTRAALHRTMGLGGLLGVPVASAADAIHGALSGHAETGAQDYWISHAVDPNYREAQQLDIHPETERQNFGGKVAGGVGGLLPDLLAMFATGGEAPVAGGIVKPIVERSVTRQVADAAGRAVQHSAAASIVPGASRGAAEAVQTVDDGGSILEALGHLPADYAKAVVQNTLPLAAGARAGAGVAERVLTKGAQGAVAMPAVTAAMNQLDGVPTTGSDLGVQAVLGALMAQMGGDAPHDFRATDPVVDPNQRPAPGVEPRQGGEPVAGPVDLKPLPEQAALQAAIDAQRQAAQEPAQAPPPPTAATPAPEARVETPVEPAAAAEPAPPAPAKPALADVLKMPENDYIAAVNPEGKQQSADDHVILHTGDLPPTEAPKVAEFAARDGTPVAVHRDEHGNLQAVVDGDVVATVDGHDGETSLNVVSEHQGNGIGKGLMKEYLRDNPLAPSGGFSEGGEATRRAAFRELQAEQAPEPVAAPEPVKPSAKEYKAQIAAAKDRGKDAPRETITPADDAALGDNPDGNPVYERKDGSRYIMRNGRPDFGGLLLTAAEAKADRETPPPAPAAKPAEAAPDTGIKHDVVDAEREAKGKDHLHYDGERQFGDAWGTASKRITDNPSAGTELAQSILLKPRPLSAEESSVLIQHRAKLHNDHRAAMRDVEAAMESGDETGEALARGRLKTAEDALDLNDHASRASGYEQGFGLAARKMMAKADYTLASLVTRAKVKLGHDIPAETRTKLEGMAKRIEDLETQLAAKHAEGRRAKAERIPAAARKVADDEFAALAKKLQAIRAKDQMVDPACHA